MKLGGVIIVGLLLGLAGGLIYTWFLAPVEYYDTYPPMLAPRYRQDWIRMTVLAYGIEGNRSRTETRLLELPRTEISVIAAEALEQSAAADQPLPVLKRLAELAAAYGASGPGVEIYSGASPTGVPTRGSEVSALAPTPTLTPIPMSPTVSPTAFASPTPTPVPVSSSPFRIISQTFSCDPQPVIAVSLEISRTVQERGRTRQELVGLPVREVWLIWDGGADRAITGFKLDRGLGYADFAVQPGRAYNLYVDTPSGPPLLTVQVEPCSPTEGSGWVSRLLTLQKTVEPDPVATPTPTMTATPSPPPAE